MNRKELPLSFVMNLAQNEDALKQYESKSKAEKAKIINKTHNIKSRSEMKSFVNGLSAQSESNEKAQEF